jgi:hypothetical protein
MYKNPPELTNCITHPEFYDAPIGWSMIFIKNVQDR